MSVQKRYGDTYQTAITPGEDSKTDGQWTGKEHLKGSITFTLCLNFYNVHVFLLEILS